MRVRGKNSKIEIEIEVEEEREGELSILELDEKLRGKGLSRDKGKKYGMLGTHLGAAWRELGFWNASESVEG